VELPSKLKPRPGYVVPEVKPAKMPAIWGVKRTASALNWSMLDSRVLACALQTILDADCALLIGTTRDHTAVTLKLYVGKEANTIYLGTVEALELALNEAIDAFASQAEDVRQLFGLSTAQT